MRKVRREYTHPAVQEIRGATLRFKMLIGDYPYYAEDYRRYVEETLALHPRLSHVRAPLQLEHTLVMAGGRNSVGFRPGTVPSPGSSRHCARPWPTSSRAGPTP